MDRLHFLFWSIFATILRQKRTPLSSGMKCFGRVSCWMHLHGEDGNLLSCNSFRCNCNFCHSLFVFHSDDPQQNVISYLPLVFNTVFYALSHGTFLFSLHGSSKKNSKLRCSDWLLRNFNQSESGYLSYHGEQNVGHHAKEYWKPS